MRVQAGAGWARLEVSDQGPGIEPADQQRIFERFEQGSAGAPDTGGFGLGLYIVREVATAHGGSVEVHSRPGQGATFLVKLPMEPPTGTA